MQRRDRRRGRSCACSIDSKQSNTYITRKAGKSAVSATDANRRFSELLRGVREGRTYVITSHGRPLAKMIPVDEETTRREAAKAALIARREARPAIDVGRWRREGLYEDIVRRLPPERTLVPIHALAELFFALVRKARWPAAEARASILFWGDAFPLIESSSGVPAAAADLAVDHKLSIRDAVVVASAADAHCRLLLSEDLQDGFTWSGVTVANPFPPRKHPLLEDLLAT